jgi:hypothetical protein
MELSDTSSVFYHLPMNTLIGRTSVNPSGLDANIDGSTGLPRSVRGAMDNAIRIRGRREWLQVTGPGHRYECFGDLEKCSKGMKAKKKNKIISVYFFFFIMTNLNPMLIKKNHSSSIT